MDTIIDYCQKLVEETHETLLSIIAENILIDHCQKLFAETHETSLVIISKNFANSCQEPAEM